MRVKLLIAMVTCMFVVGAVVAYEAVQAQMKPADTSATTATDEQQIEKLVRDFLNGAGTNDVTAHERFWADELVYTGSSGTVRTKAEILKNVREASAKPDPNEPKTTFSAEDRHIQVYGEFAVVNFRLVAHTEKDGKPDNMNFRNTGTLRRAHNEWRVIAWQATRIEEKKPEEPKPAVKK
jgi:ketosteroid isomerase-like protein